MSNQIYVISDLHFGHEKIAKLRGFKNSEIHDLFIVSEWNRVVKKRDTVWILGDIAITQKHLWKLKLLNGIKKVVLGNHDLPQYVEEIEFSVSKICGSFKYKDCVLTHIPIHPKEFYRWRKNIHGHTHDKNIKRFGIFNDKRYKNVSVENIGYAPILLSEVIK